MIIPIGLLAFISGYRHHQNLKVLLLGVPGLFIVGLIPLVVHRPDIHHEHNVDHAGHFLESFEPALMILGSLILIGAHYINRRSCACSLHKH